MADQLNLFDLFEDTFGEDTVITEVAAAKEEKKSEKKASKKEVKVEKITLPVTVYASQWKEEIAEIDGKTEVTLDELKDYLVAEGYVEIKASFTEVVKEDEGVVVGISGVSTSYPQTPILGEEFTVATGQYTMTLNAEADFEGLEKNLGVVAKKWEEQYPQYAGTKLITDLSGGFGYPIVGEEVGENLSAGAKKYYYNGAVQEIELTEETSIDDFVKKVTGIAGGKIYLADDVYFVTLCRRSTKKGGKATSTTKTPAAKKEVKKFTLPFTATFTHCADKTISTEQFPDKTEVTEDEFIAWLSNVSEEYTQDKTELLYFKEDNVVEVRLRSAKRG